VQVVVVRRPDHSRHVAQVHDRGRGVTARLGIRGQPEVPAVVVGQQPLEVARERAGVEPDVVGPDTRLRHRSKG
jgi:hypothetical protein